MEPNQTTDQNNEQTSAKQQIIDRLKEASNVLVTVSNNPSVDQLAACIGLTLLLNRLGKHGTAVFSGAVPHTVEFLQPEKTLEKSTDSLRDFIIALDKSKADKLRYKVEEKTVKIFITPYRASLSDQDLDFSHGDFNVDVVLALGVHEQGELDAAITAQGRILHDATIISINNKSESSLGTINWHDERTSSLCEMLVGVGEALKKDFLDEQMATAFLTGIVAETERFSNEKTTPQTMAAAGKLMAAGANQQLISSELEEPEPEAEPIPEAELALAPEPEKPAEDTNSGQPPTDSQDGPPDAHDGTLQITHDDPGQAEGSVPDVSSQPEEAVLPSPGEIQIDEEGTLRHAEEMRAQEMTEQAAGKMLPSAERRHALIDPAAMPQPSQPQDSDSFPPSSENAEALDLPPVEPSRVPLLSHDSPLADAPPPATSQTLSQIEESTNSPHVQAASDPASAPGVPADISAPPPDLDAARGAVAEVVETTPTQEPLDPIVALNAMPGLEIDHNAALPDQPLNQPDQSGAGAASPPPAPDWQPPEPPPPPPSSPSPPPPPPVPPPWQPSTASDDGQANTMPSSSNPFTLPPTS